MAQSELFISAPLDIDVSIIPWSHRGSLLSLSTKSGVHGRLTPGHDVYLITQCKSETAPLFALRPLPRGETLGPPSGFHKTPSPTTFEATPSLLQWSHAGSIVAQATFQDVRCIRFRGTVPFAFDNDVTVDDTAYMFTKPPFQGSRPTIEFNTYTLKSHRFVALKGKLTTINGHTQEMLNRRIQIEADGSSNEWDLLVCEVETVSDGSDTIKDTCEDIINEAAAIQFNEAAQRMNAAVDGFAKALCPWSSPAPTESERLASYVIWTSMVRAEGTLTREAILMSKLWMNKVWSWDNCINALAITTLSSSLALDQILMPYDHQAPDGRIPDSIGWSTLEWGYTKPPIQGWVLMKLLKQDPQVEAKTLSDIYYHTAKFTNFWMQYRGTDHSALPWYSHGNDSGWDNSTAFDGQPVIVGPDCAAFLIIQCVCLEDLASRLKLPQPELQRWSSLKQHLIDSLVSELWDNETGSFMVMNALTGATRTTTSLLRLMPLTAAAYLPPPIVDKMSADLSRHLTRWGLATEELESPLYEPDGYWRGPIWAPVTLLIESGLRMAGRTELANTISHRFIQLCMKAGFAENYDATRGVGLRDLSYTWASSAFLVLSREAAQRASDMDA